MGIPLLSSIVKSPESQHDSSRLCWLHVAQASSKYQAGLDLMRAELVLKARKVISTELKPLMPFSLIDRKSQHGQHPSPMPAEQSEQINRKVFFSHSLPSFFLFLQKLGFLLMSNLSSIFIVDFISLPTATESCTIKKENEIEDSEIGILGHPASS